MLRYGFPATRMPALRAQGGRVNQAGAHLYQTTLEKNYPRVLEAIQAMWGYPELNTYFRKLTMDERGNRDGFPPEVWDDLYLLLYLHLEIVPEPLF